MNPTKEELDKAIEYYEDMLNQNVPLDMEERTALTILTRYRDGELVEKKQFEVSIQVRNGQMALVHNGDVLCLFTNEGKPHIETIVGILNPTN